MQFFVIFLTVWPVFLVAADDDKFKFVEPAMFEIKVDREHPEEIYKAFEDFKIKYNRTYKDASEAQQRFNNFVKSYNNVQELNAKSKAKGYDTQFGINKFADLSSAEFSSGLSGMPPNNTGLPVLDDSFFRKAETNKTRHKRRSTRYPDYLDLRTMKVNGRYIVGPVKNQGQCACCWGFAVTAVIETANAVSSGRFTSLADQELCDCATYGTPGCKGGSLNNGVAYVREYGLASDDDYKYYEDRAYTRSRCRVKEYDRVVLKKTFKYGKISPRYAEEDIIKFLNNAKVPVAVYFRVGDQMRAYKEGVIVDDDCDRRGKVWHAGAIVGYDTVTDDRTGRKYDYWIVKNSWDNDWGEHGYFRIIRNIDWCNIEDSPVSGVIQDRY